MAGFMKAVDHSLSNGVIVGRMARTADQAGTQEQTGNGRINMARALTDTSTEEIKPAGADPVGQGGPFVGPYRAAAFSVAVNFPVNSITYNTASASSRLGVGVGYCRKFWDTFENTEVSHEQKIHCPTFR